MGVTTKTLNSKDYPHVEPKPFNKARLSMTYAEAVEDSRKWKENQQKVQAYKKALAEGTDPIEALKPNKQIVVEGPITTYDELPKSAKAEVPFVKKGKSKKV